MYEYRTAISYLVQCVSPIMSRVQAIPHRVIAGITSEDQRAAEGPDLPADDRLAA